VALYGVLGDIHGNAEALGAALEALKRRGSETLLCLGDIIGYNADPDECVALVRARRALAIAGNHDLIALGKLGTERCSNKAMYSLKRTRRRLSRESALFLAALPPHQLIDNAIVLVHGGVREVQQYMVAPSHIRENAAYLREDFPQARVCFFGHTHEPKVYEVRGETVRELPASGRLQLAHEQLYFINPGSVDAARKREHKLAECALFDTGAWTVEFLRVPYDAASAEIKAAMGGYRISPWTERFYSFKRRLLRA
jgi:predicted phosphodiesterase